MFNLNYFPSHYFAPRYWAEHGSDGANGQYFAPYYFPARYFGLGYWAQGGQVSQGFIPVSVTAAGILNPLTVTAGIMGPITTRAGVG